MHTLDEDQRSLLELVRGFAATEVAPTADRHERDREFPRALFDQLAAMDLTGLIFDEEVGGTALPYRTYLMVLEELARASLALGMGMSVHTLATWGIDTYATPEQRERFVPDLVAGRALGAYSLSEPGSGSDAAAMTTRARRDGDVYRLDGVKAWVTHGGVADRYLVMARTSQEGARGISAFVIDADQPGMTVSPPESKMGLWASPTAQLVFEDAPVPTDRLLGGEEGTGFQVAMSSLDGGRLGIAACAVGLAQAALDASIDYAKQREQFGRPIAGFQLIQDKLAQMLGNLTASLAMAVRLAQLQQNSRMTDQDAALAKGWIGRRMRETVALAREVCGGNGITLDTDVARFFADAEAVYTFEGTNEINNLIVGRSITGINAFVR